MYFRVPGLEIGVFAEQFPQSRRQEYLRGFIDVVLAYKSDRRPEIVMPIKR
jgi:hypothetical protein